MDWMKPTSLLLPLCICMSCNKDCKTIATCNLDCTKGEIQEWDEINCACITVQNQSGCTDAEANNYNPSAICDDGRCLFDKDNFIGNYIGAVDCNDNGYIVNEIFKENYNFIITNIEESLTNDDVFLTFETEFFNNERFHGRVEENKIVLTNMILYQDVVILIPNNNVSIEVSIADGFTLLDSTLEGQLLIRSTPPNSLFENFSCKLTGQLN